MSRVASPGPETVSQSGMVTAELAVALPVLAVVLAGCLAVMSAVSLQLRCEDAAGLAARAAARGDLVVAVEAAAGSDVTGVMVRVTRQGDLVRAVVTATTHPLGAYGPGVPVSATATALNGVDLGGVDPDGAAVATGSG